MGQTLELLGGQGHGEPGPSGVRVRVRAQCIVYSLFHSLDFVSNLHLCFRHCFLLVPSTHSRYVFRTALTPTGPSRPIRDQNWMALYFCNSSLFLPSTSSTSDDISRHSVSYLCVSYGPTRMVTTGRRYDLRPLATRWTCTRTICVSTTLHLLSGFSVACIYTTSLHLLDLSLYLLVYMPEWTPVGHNHIILNTLICQWAHSITRTFPSCLCTMTHPRLLTAYGRTIKFNLMLRPCHRQVRCLLILPHQSHLRRSDSKHSFYRQLGTTVTSLAVGCLRHLPPTVQVTSLMRVFMIIVRVPATPLHQRYLHRMYTDHAVHFPVSPNVLGLYHI